MQDTEQLRAFATTGSEDAFAALVQRYLPLVYASALRRVGGDTHRAEDVAQMVFTALARNARTLARHPDLTGWLFTTTRFLAAKAVRSERRRQSREDEAGRRQEIEAMNAASPHASPASVDAMLDDVLMELRQLDRQMILLRFHRGLRLAEIGAQLGASENAVQKRLDRALEELKEKLARRGVTSTASALVLAFEQQSAIALPAGLAAATTTAGLAVGTGVGVGGLFTFSSLVAVSKLQLGLAAVTVGATSAGLVWQVHENSTLRSETARQMAAVKQRSGELSGQLALLTERAEAAEAEAARLQKTVEANAAARAANAASVRVLNDEQQQAKAALERGDQLARDGRFQEALAEYLLSYQRSGALRVASTEQQSAMIAIMRLGQKFPPAVAALRELREAARKNLEASRGRREFVTEIALLNERLDDGAASLALYDSLPPGDEGRQSVASISSKAFVAARRYADVLVGKNYGAMISELEMRIKSASRQSGPPSAAEREYILGWTLDDIETLTGVGRTQDAERLAERLRGFDSSEETRAAIQRRVERAVAPVSPL